MTYGWDKIYWILDSIESEDKLSSVIIDTDGFASIDIVIERNISDCPICRQSHGYNHWYKEHMTGYSTA